MTNYLVPSLLVPLFFTHHFSHLYACNVIIYEIMVYTTVEYGLITVKLNMGTGNRINLDECEF